jgi:hypothetical protein
MVRPSIRAARRAAAISEARDSGVPWAQLTRKTSAPARISWRMRVTLRVAGPSVATILVRVGQRRWRGAGAGLTAPG